VADVAVTVIDDWQGRGPGTLLLEVLSARARDEGIRSFTALMLASNEEMMDTLKRLDRVRVFDPELGTVTIEVPIPAIGLASALRKRLRISGNRCRNSSQGPPQEAGADSPAARKLTRRRTVPLDSPVSFCM
jgi:hypothetical protein